MNFYTRQHKHYCGIDLHARAMYVCILDQSGTILVHKNLPTTPEAFLRIIAPYREDLVALALSPGRQSDSKYNQPWQLTHSVTGRCPNCPVRVQVRPHAGSGHVQRFVRLPALSVSRQHLSHCSHPLGCAPDHPCLCPRPAVHFVPAHPTVGAARARTYGSLS